MKLSLIFAPQAIPTSAPLGIAQLKSFIEADSEHRVKNIDLNPFFYSNTITNYVGGKFDLYKEKEKSKKSRNFVRKAEEIFKGKNKEDFFDAKVYNPCANEFLFLFDSVFRKNNNFLFNYVNGNTKQVPGLDPFIGKIGKPDMVGFSILTAEQTYFSLALAKKIKEELNIPVVVGGGAVRLYPEKYLNFDFVDYVIKGDGEQPIVDLLDDKNLEDINNLNYIKNNKIINNKEINTKNIDEIPFPDYSDFDLDSYFCPEKVISVLTSRGCYWRRCAFCSDCDSIAMQYRIKKIERLLEEIDYLKKKYNTKYFFFADEMVAPNRFKQISDALIDTNILYYTQVRPTKEFNKELLINIYKSGCKLLMWGVESGSQRILDLMDKGTKVEEINNVLRDSHSAGIKNAVFAFGGFPTETEEDYNQTIDFLERNRKFIDIQFTGYFRVSENSGIMRNPSDFSITDISEDKESDPLMPTYNYKVSKGITQEQLMELFKKNYAFFLELSKFSPFLGKFRDHMLVRYS